MPSLRTRRALLMGVAALLLAACASEPKYEEFHREDGPPERVPPGLLSTPDAVPRDEPLNPYSNRPYSVLGRRYVPDTSTAPFHQRGIASWYGRQFQGSRTASGERYDMFAMTAAHPTLPIPSYARVTNTHEGRSVVVRINDRGPFLQDRVIDLSYVAAARLGLAGPAGGEVEIDRILPGQFAGATAQPDISSARAADAAPAPSAAQPMAAAEASAARTVPADIEVPPPPAAAAQGAPAVREGAPEPASPTVAVDPVPAPPASIAPRLDPASRIAADGAAAPPAPAGSRWSVQMGAFAVAANAEAFRDRLALLLGAPEASVLPPELRTPRIERHGGLDRVLIGKASERAVALRWSRLLERYLSLPSVLFVH